MNRYDYLDDVVGLIAGVYLILLEYGLIHAKKYKPHLVFRVSGYVLLFICGLSLLSFLLKRFLLH